MIALALLVLLLSVLWAVFADHGYRRLARICIISNVALAVVAWLNVLHH